METFVQIILILVTSIVRCGTFNGPPNAKAELRPRMKTHNQAKNHANNQANPQTKHPGVIKSIAKKPKVTGKG